MLDEQGKRTGGDATSGSPNAQAAEACTATSSRSPAADAPRVSLLELMFGGVLRPRKAARRASHLHLSTAFAIHTGFAFLIIATVAATRAWQEEFFANTAISDIPEMILVWLDVFDAATPTDYLLDYVVPWLINLCALELILIAIAFALSSWGAREEPVRKTLANAVRQTWLHTPSVFYAVLAIAALVIAINWNFRWDFRQLAEAIPLALKDGVDFLVKLHRLLRTWDSSGDDVIVPWFETNNTTLGLAALTLALGWLFATLLARIGARPVQKACERPPRCESCGYILYGIDADGRCPECGASVRNVIGPDARPGVPWQSSNGLVHIGAWFSTALYQLIRPASFGRRMKRMPGNFHHRTYALISVLLVAAYTCVGVLYYNHTVHVFDSKHDFSRLEFWPLSNLQLAFFCLLSLIPGSIAAVVALTSCASLVGGWLRLRHGESATAAAMQAACYASWLLPLACMTFFLVATGVVTESSVLAWIAGFGSTTPIDHSFAFAIIPIVIILAIMTFIVARTTGAMRYAHR